MLVGINGNLRNENVSSSSKVAVAVHDVESDESSP